MYQKIIKCFSIYIPIHIIANILNEEEIASLFFEICINKEFEKSDTEIETNDSIEEKKYRQEYADEGIILLDDLGQKEMEDPRV